MHFVKLRSVQIWALSLDAALWGGEFQKCYDLYFLFNLEAKWNDQHLFTTACAQHWPSRPVRIFPIKRSLVYLLLLFVLFWDDPMRLHHHHHHHHQSLNREGRWGTTYNSQPVFFIFLCSPQPSGTCRNPCLSIPWCCLPTSSSVCLGRDPGNLGTHWLRSVGANTSLWPGPLFDGMVELARPNQSAGRAEP